VTLEELMVRTLMRGHEHPLRVEQDWTYEVLDKDNEIVLKCMTFAQAAMFVTIAIHITQQDAIAAEDLNSVDIDFL